MKKLLALLMVMAMTGCATQRFEVQPSLAQEAASYDDSQTFWVAGIGQKEEIDAAKVCGGAKKVARTETQLTPGNIGLAIVTIGIYTPRQIRVYCTR
jgi:hypothetical protein